MCACTYDGRRGCDCCRFVAIVGQVKYFQKTRTRQLNAASARHDDAWTFLRLAFVAGLLLPLLLFDGLGEPLSRGHARAMSEEE